MVYSCIHAVYSTCQGEEQFQFLWRNAVPPFHILATRPSKNIRFWLCETVEQRFFFLGAPGRSPGAPEPPRKEKYRLGKYFFRGAAPETPRPGSAPGKKKPLFGEPSIFIT